MNPYLAVEGLRIAFGAQFAVDGLSLTVARGEFLTLLGPSGCGKTTTLRALAGFVKPAQGRIIVDGSDITALPPHKRNIGVVFQSYALFPHLTAQENVAFGLRMRQVARTERDRRAKNALAMVGLSGLEDRYPGQLSGGQQQRVALARALVIEPAILLLDEPLSNLDTNLRAELRQEIRNLQKRVKITTILVTHDQQEAMAVSDRVAILRDGRIADIGTPEELCNQPSDPFAARFMGARTVIAGVTRGENFEAPGLICGNAPSGATQIVLKAWRLRLNETGGPLLLVGRVTTRIYVGDHFETEVDTPSGFVRVIVPAHAPPPPVGAECVVSAWPDGISFIVGQQGSGA